MEFKSGKFKELVLYIAGRTMDDPGFGVTKMAKTLWLSDFRAFATLGEPITGAEYQKLAYGPAARQYLPIFEEMVMQGDAAEAEQGIWDNPSRRVIALRKAILEDFLPQEISIIDATIEEIKKKSAREISDMSHHSIGWEFADMSETIPYGTALIPRSKALLSKSDIDYALKVVIPQVEAAMD